MTNIKVAIYARVSTSDKEQDVTTQLLPLREFVRSQSWEIFKKYIDQVPATDLVLVWRMDRASRLVLDAATTLERLRSWKVGLGSFFDPWLDTTSPFGEALYYITVAYAQLERRILRERVKAGTERARKEGQQIGRPKVTDRPGFNRRFGDILEHLRVGNMSRHQAAKELNIGYATLVRLLDKQSNNGENS